MAVKSSVQMQSAGVEVQEGQTIEGGSISRGSIPLYLCGLYSFLTPDVTPNMIGVVMVNLAEPCFDTANSYTSKCTSQQPSCRQYLGECLFFILLCVLRIKKHMF